MYVWLGILAVALALAMDAFAVSVAAGIKLSKPDFCQTIRMSACFGLFQCFMPFVGWFTGHKLASIVAAWDHWVAFGLLMAVGGKMIVDASTSHDTDKLKEKSTDPTRGLTLLMLGIATSIDAFAVGVSMAILERPLWVPCITFGTVAAALSAIGIRYGGRIGQLAGRRAEIAGGAVLILIGTVTLVSHLVE